MADVLATGQVLRPDQALTSAQGRYTLVYQGDGNLALYKNYRHQPARALWGAGTEGRPAGGLVMQDDGNLVIYGPNWEPMWATGTEGHPGASLVVQDDGNVVIYSPDGQGLWATDTVSGWAPEGPAPTGGVMRAGEVLGPDRALASPDGRYTLVYQGDGNLVLYKEDLGAPGGSGRVYQWDSATDGRPAGGLVMQDDGNVVIYGPDGQSLWATGTEGHPGASLVVQDDGNLVVYDADGSPVWASDTPRITLQSKVPEFKGWIEVTLRPSGEVRFRAYLDNENIEAVKYRIRAVVHTNGQAVVLQRSGNTGGWLAGGTDKERWDETSHSSDVERRYREFERAYPRLDVATQTRGSVSGPVTDVLDFALKFVVGGILIGPITGAIIFVGAELASLATSGSLVPGARILSGVLWLAGPYGTLYALAAEGVAALGSRERPISPEEYAEADKVFAGTLPDPSKIVITDQAGAYGNAFVYPRFDDKITVNLGPDRYDNPLHTDPGTLIHELVHVWQIHHTTMEVGWITEGLIAQAGRSPETYEPGSPGKDWDEYNLEQQGTIITRWYLGGMLPQSPWYRYVEHNIRLGKT
jgi:hypothetical protein